ncbi:MULTISPECIES: hypothetical protein [unclassified Candidatus Tisiphia]|uniref:hypothetical protein n=1 Tax=unclassified Candidatus Tisiphia TaxID=2996318 RepID=UPI00312C8BB5
MTFINDQDTINRLWHKMLYYAQIASMGIMEFIRTKLGDGGRVIIPSIFRHNLSLMAGDDIILHMKDETIYITTPNQALSKLQAKVKNHINATSQNVSLVDELIAMRRLEAIDEKLVTSSLVVLATQFS